MSEGTSGADSGDSGRIRQQAIRGVVWTSLDKWSVRLSTFVGFTLLGHLLSPKAFGVVALASTFITILTSLADGGFSQYLMQHRRLTDAIESSAFYTSVFLATALAGALVLLAGRISAWMGTPELRQILPALALAVLISGFSSVPAMLLWRQLRFKDLALRSVLSTVLSVAAAITLAFLGAGVWALVAQTLVRNVVSLIALWFATDFRPRWTYDLVEVRAMTSYGVKSLGVQLGNQLNEQGQIFLIGALAGPVALGYWTVAIRLVGVVVEVCTSVISTVANPVFARLQTNPKRLSEVLGTAMRMAAFVTAPILVFVSLTSRQLVPAIFGAQWLPSAVLVSVLAMRGLLAALSSFHGSVLMATGHPAAEVAYTVSLVTLQLTIVAIVRDDMLQLAVLLMVATALTLPIRFVLVHRLLEVPARTYSQTLAVLLAAGIATAAAIGAQKIANLSGYYHIVLVLVVGSVAYAAVVMWAARPVVHDFVGAVGPLLAKQARRRPVNRLED